MGQKGFANLILIGAFVILLGLGGYFAWSKKTPQENINKISDTPSSNLKTYVSDLGYSVNYPADWVVLEDEGRIQPINPEEDNGIPFEYFSVFLDTSQFNPVLVRTFEEVRQSEKENFGGRDRIESAVTFGGENGYSYIEKFDVDKYSFLEIIVPHNQKVYHIWTQKYNLDEVKQIFASFKFTDSLTQTDTSNWKTYTNEELKYSVKYPPNWHIYEPGAGSSIDEVKEVIFSQKLDPQFGGEAEEDVGPYLSISIDPRSLEQMREVMKNIAHKKETIDYFNGLTTFSYTSEEENTPDYSSYILAIPYNGKTYWLSTSKFHFPEVKTMMKSFRFID